MTQTKFESLPNEILTELFERYINGIDIINAFAFQLNGRIDSLILNCKRFRFDFVECHKDEFRFTMGLLPAYIDRIEELALSEYKTPGQIYAFLNYFPKFENFTKLRRLYIDAFLPETVKSMLFDALHALPTKSVDTLAFLIKSDWFTDDEYDYFRYRRTTINSIETLKKFSAPVEIYTIFCSSLPNLQSLTLKGICNRDLFHSLINEGIRLKYLNIQIDLRSSSLRQLKTKPSQLSVMPLETLIIQMINNDLNEVTYLQECFAKMPMIRRLELTGGEAMADSNTWQTTLNKCLKNLNYFRLTIDSSSIKPEKCLTIVNEFQGTFWLEKNFQLIIRPEPPTDQSVGDRYFGPNFVEHCWSAPRRDNTADIVEYPAKTLVITTACQSVLHFYQYPQLNELIIEDFNANLFATMNEYLPKSRIHQLTIHCPPDQHQLFVRLLSVLPNLKKLTVPYQLLLPQSGSQLGKYRAIQSLDLSSNLHGFSRETMLSIHQTFPNLKHLSIHTKDLQSIAQCGDLMAHLHSLQFKLFFPESRRRRRSDTEYDQKLWIYKLFHRTNLSFCTHGDTMTIWFGHDDFQPSIWTNFLDKNDNSDSFNANPRYGRLYTTWMDYD